MIEGAQQKTLEAQGLRFTAFEMGQGPLVLCLHGFPDTPYSFRHMLPALAQAGFRAVAVTLRGYEPGSQPPDRDYSMAALAQDAPAWIDALGEQTAHLVGHDWGASVVYSAAAHAPQRIGKIVVMSVPHPAAFAARLLGDFEQMRRSWYIYLFQLAGAAEMILPANEFAFLMKLWKDWSPGWSDAAAFHAMQNALSQPGVLSAALEYYRTAFNAAHPRAAESASLLATPIQAPALGICGAEDGCISADVFEAAMPAALFAGGVRTMRIAGAGHFVHAEKPDQVNAAVIAHLR